MKRADERRAPAFDHVINRTAPTPERRLARRTLAVLGSVAAGLVMLVALTRSQEDGRREQTASRARFVAGPGDSVAEIDFDRLRRMVEEHRRAPDNDSDAGSPVWSSRTESLLTLNLDMALTPE